MTPCCAFAKLSAGVCRIAHGRHQHWPPAIASPQQDVAARRSAEEEDSISSSCARVRGVRRILQLVAPRPVQERAAPLPGVSAAGRITLAPELLYSSPKLRELKLELLLRLPFREALHHERTHHCLAPLQLRAQMSDELGVAQRVAGRLPVDGGRLPSFVVRLVARAAGGA